MQIANSWGMYGILNAQGTPWTPRVFDTEREAQAYLDECRRGWPSRGDPLPRHKVAPVNVTVARTKEDLPSKRSPTKKARHRLRQRAYHRSGGGVAAVVRVR